MKSKRIFFPILSEIFFTFCLGLIIFTLILLTFQILRLTEVMLLNNASLIVFGKLMFYLTIRFLPILIPMSLLFSTISVYGRLNGQSEIIALKSVGMNKWQVAAPAIFVGIVVYIICLNAFFFWAPLGRDHFDTLYFDLKKTHISNAIKPGTFTSSLKNVVVYANEVDDKGGLKGVFVFDERSGKDPVTVVSKFGQIETLEGNAANIILNQGSIHKVNKIKHTKVAFGEYSMAIKEKSNKKKHIDIESFDFFKLKEGKDKNIKKYVHEYYRRWSVSFSCLLFSFFGVGLAVRKTRSKSSGAMTISVFLIVLYWALTMGSESLLNKNILPQIVCIWLPNLLLIPFAAWRFQKINY